MSKPTIGPGGRKFPGNLDSNVVRLARSVRPRPARIRGQPVIDQYLQGGPRGQGQILLEAAEVERIQPTPVLSFRSDIRGRFTNPA
jgi:hypothetical protein